MISIITLIQLQTLVYQVVGSLATLRKASWKLYTNSAELRFFSKKLCLFKYGD
jgi:hypothetical protein